MADQPRRVLLLAEDDRFLRKATEAALRRGGFTVLTASDGEEALRLARSESLDVILLDMIMPKVQGFEVLRELKKSPGTASIPVIVLSNLGQEGDSKAALEMGAADYWVKANLALGDLAKRVAGVLGTGDSQ